MAWKGKFCDEARTGEGVGMGNRDLSL